MVEERKRDYQGMSLVQALISLFLSFGNPVGMVYFELAFLIGGMHH